ncbi:uncharacterized protein LOC126369188 isoform X2 [Pectinophora gossypiella]|nr:uncharacterized protein LOC126369188 isoform X2 [Pectinophora gossypiella]
MYAEEILKISRHLFATKYWFGRISGANKRRYILALMEDMRSAWALSLILKSIWNCRPKDAVLSVCEKHVLSQYDQVPIDHNRTAQPVKTLGQVMTNDRKWFHSLEPEPQAMVFLELLTMAGGPVIWEVLRRGQHIFERHREVQLRNLLECIVVEPQDKNVKKDAPTAQPSKFSSTSVTAQSPSQVQAHKNLETSLAAWNAIIKTIRDSQKLEELEMTFTDGTTCKIWKVNRPRPEGIETVDFVQLLPSNVGKKILSFLPREQLQDYAKVNRYWAFLVEELRADWMTRAKLNSDLQKLQDVMLKHDTSLEVLAPPDMMVMTAGSTGVSLSPSSRGRQLPSLRASERSAGGVSFRHFVVENLKPSHKLKPKPLKKLADLDDRLEIRGAADENIWRWCDNVLKYTKGERHPKATKTEEGVMDFGEAHFPCPMMKHSIQLPLARPLYHDPAQSNYHSLLRRNVFTYEAMANMPMEPNKRFSLWSRDFSSLYRVFKVASYESPI